MARENQGNSRQKPKWTIHFGLLSSGYWASPPWRRKQMSKQEAHKNVNVNLDTNWISWLRPERKRRQMEPWFGEGQQTQCLMYLLWLWKRERREGFYLQVIVGEVGLWEWRDGIEWRLRLSQRFGTEPAVGFQTLSRMTGSNRPADGNDWKLGMYSLCLACSQKVFKNF